MVGTSFESRNSIFCKKKVIFCAFLEPKRYDCFSVLDDTALVPKRHKKLQIFYKNYFL